MLEIVVLGGSSDAGGVIATVNGLRLPQLSISVPGVQLSAWRVNGPE